MRNYIRSTTTTTGLTVKAFLVDRAFQKGRKLSKEQRHNPTDTATYLSNLELYDCTNIDILNLNQTATLFADSYLAKVLLITVQTQVLLSNEIYISPRRKESGEMRKRTTLNILGHPLPEINVSI